MITLTGNSIKRIHCKNKWMIKFTFFDYNKVAFSTTTSPITCTDLSSRLMLLLLLISLSFFPTFFVEKCLGIFRQKKVSSQRVLFKVTLDVCWCSEIFNQKPGVFYTKLRFSSLLLLSLSICSMWKYYISYETDKLISEKQKKYLFYEENSRIDSESFPPNFRVFAFELSYIVE